MAKQQTREIKNWKELEAFVEEINLYENTIILSGWINKIKRDGTFKLDKLIFTSKPLYYMKEVISFVDHVDKQENDEDEHNSQ